jgi:hypothetical protein
MEMANKQRVFMFVFGNQQVKEIKFWLCFERIIKKQYVCSLNKTEKAIFFFLLK